MVHVSWSQEQTTFDIDENYLEDQFYAGLAYNFLGDRIDDIIQRNFSYNLHLGFIKDLPLNQKRNFAVGIGLGYAANSYYTNLLATETDQGIVYEIPESIDFNRGKFETHAIEMPFEIRWRTSNPIDYRFWRVYAGAKLSYNFSGKSKYVFEDSKNSFSNNDINDWNYGLTLNVGYNTFNVHFYYGLNHLLDDNTGLNGDSITLRPIRIGVIFYIL